MKPSEKNTKRVVLALDQAYEKFVQLEDESTDEAQIVAYRCYYTNIYESKLYVEQMQKEIERLKAEKTKAFDYLFSKFAGHSNYHGDSVLCAIEAVKEGKKIETVKTMDDFGECEKNCLTCQNSFSDEEDHLHCMADGHNHEEIVADGYTCEQWS